MATKREGWTPHVGLDYAVVMAPGETTENASIRVFGGERELPGAIADALNGSGSGLSRSRAWTAMREALKAAKVVFDEYGVVDPYHCGQCVMSVPRDVDGQPMNELVHDEGCEVALVEAALKAAEEEDAT